MSTMKALYAASAAITVTLNNLPNNALRESLAVDNTANLFLDALVSVAIKLPAGAPGNFQCVNVYVYGSEDGTTFGDNATGADAGLALRAATNLRLLGTIQTPDAGGLVYRSHPMSVARQFAGSLPRKWGIVVENLTNLTFDSSGCSASYTGVNLQAV